MTDPLRGYNEILTGSREASFLRLKKHRLDMEDSAGTFDLWKIHQREMERFRQGTGGESGGANLLHLKAELASRILSSCRLCERRCQVDRTSGRPGYCGVIESRVASEFLHWGEEPPLVPSYTIFFAGCTFRCVFCQNHDISTDPKAGDHWTPESMAKRIEGVADRSVTGRRYQMNTAKNVNWVGGDPTPNLPFILRVLEQLRYSIPQIWNSNMYLSQEAMRLLDGVIDLYLTDFKYGNDRCALRLSKAPRYWEVITRNHLMAMDQGEVIVRHLVMPNHLACCTFPVLDWLSENLPDALVNVMSQYRPMHKAIKYPDIARPLGREGYLQALERAGELRLQLVV